ncbi:hypothetical protein K469DRAFT_367754 [Zopfia rhizophila CBS 207.26]|uniref:TPR-like protein n=1 Tax=Zopfia rhizophila CBS 207.26 TaxID=1314779 RepID=A0A6A6EIN6_9PEZI|nr:hypothetical protein K469DRAFT_367754 [Zopfia rhizophila CBS 207.26]
METPEGFVIVQKRLFDCMRWHCENCRHFDERLQDVSDGRVVVIPSKLSSSSKKRKTPHRSESQRSDRESSESSQQVSTETSEPSWQSTESSELSQQSEIETFRQPGAEPSGKGPVKKSREAQAADRFIQNAPKTSKWRERQTELGLRTAQEYEEVIQGLTRRSHVGLKGEPHKERRQSDNELVAVGKGLARLTRSSLANANLQRSFAYFQALILLSYCEFLRRKDFPYEKIDQLIQIITDIRERDRKMLLDSIPWINGLIAHLARNGWTVHRATELFFINAVSISDLVRIRNDANSQSILEHLTTDAFVAYDYSDCLSPSYTIPGLIASHLDSVGWIANTISVNEIYVELGYELHHLPSSVEGIYKVQPARSTSDFEVLSQDSFVTATNHNPREADPSRSGNHDTGDRGMILFPEKSLPSLIYAFGGVPKFMLERAVFPQKRWDKRGVEYETKLQHASFDTHLRNLFLEKRKLWQLVEHLISLAVIGVEESDGMETYICGWKSAEFLYNRRNSYWVEQALGLFCYIFPRSPAVLPVSEREKLLAVLEHLLRQYAERGLEIPSSNEVVETLLAASKCGPLTRRRHILSLVDKLLKGSANTYLQAEAVHQRSVLLRLKGDISGSSHLLQEFLNRSDLDPQLKSHFALGLLHVSQATNHAYNFDFLLADQEAQKWMPSNATTEKELDVVWDQIHSAGRILRGRGCFNLARQFFERCLQIQPLRESKRLLVKSSLADIYVELDYLQRREINSQNSEELLDEAEAMVKPEIELLRARAQHTKGFRRLLLSMAEIEIRRGQFDNAESLLTELCDIYVRLVDPDIVDQLGHVRALIALARISPPCEAENRWTDALNLNRRYNPFEEEVFTCGLIYLFICIIRLQFGDLEGSEAAFARAAEVVRTKSPQFLIPGVGTYLFDHAQYQMESVAGWKLPRNDLCNS